MILTGKGNYCFVKTLIAILLYLSIHRWNRLNHPFLLPISQKQYYTSQHCASWYSNKNAWTFYIFPYDFFEWPEFFSGIAFSVYQYRIFIKQPFYIRILPYRKTLLKYLPIFFAIFHFTPHLHNPCYFRQKTIYDGKYITPSLI